MQVSLRGGSFQIDADDWERLKHLPWRFGYAGRRPSITRQIVRGGRIRNICIYHDIFAIEPSRGRVVDHVNGNPLDNRRSNLRLCSARENCQNRGPRKGASVPYKGVTFDRAQSRFKARIKANGVQRRLGSFATAEEAALAYDTAAAEKFGEFAWLNRDHFTPLSRLGEQYHVA